MKTKTLLMIACLFAFGCSRSPVGIQLSDQVADLQRQNKSLFLSVSNLQATVDMLEQYDYVEGHKIDSNSVAITQLVLSQLKTESDQMESQSARVAALGDIPADVEAKIRDDAAQQFPDNYVMQKAAIESQEEAYKSLHQ